MAGTRRVLRLAVLISLLLPALLLARPAGFLLLFRLLWPSGKHITPKLRAFVDFVVEYVELEKTHQ